MRSSSKNLKDSAPTLKSPKTNTGVPYTVSYPLGLRAMYFGAAAIVGPANMLMLRRDWKGQEHLHDSGMMLAVTHTSALAPLSMGHRVYSTGRFPHFWAKKELCEWPAVGKLITSMKQIPVDRA